MPNYVITRFIPGPVGGGGSGTITGLTGDTTGSGVGVITTTTGALASGLVKVQGLTGAPTNFAIYLGSLIPTATNSSFIVGANGSTQINTSAANGGLFLGNAGSVGLTVVGPGGGSGPTAGLPAGSLCTSLGGLVWTNQLVTPLVYQITTFTDVATQPFTCGAQSAWAGASVNVNGAPFLIAGGDSTNPGSTGLRGPTRINLGRGSAATGIELAEVAVGRRATALNQLGSGLTSTQLPALTGDGVTYLGNAQTAPTNGHNPVSGALLYSTGGVLYGLNGTGPPFALGASSSPSDGSDGAIVCDGVATYPKLTGPVLAAGVEVYTANEDIYATTIDVKSGCAIITAGFAIYASTSILVETGGLIYNGGDNGSNGSSGGTGGATTASGTVGGGAAGGAGGNNGAGTAGTAGSNQGRGATSPAGGAGGSGTNAGGAGGAYSHINADHAGGLRSRWGAMSGSTFGAGGLIMVMGGSGGGGGGAAGGTETGGGGGAGGGVMVLAAPYITNNGSISANGGPGGNGFSSAAGKAGGGGGGGGGIVYTVGLFSGTAPTVTGGAGGTAVNAGVAGSAGGNGFLIQVSP